MFSGRFDACLRQDRTARGEAAGGGGTALPTDDSGLAAASRYATEVRWSSALRLFWQGLHPPPHLVQVAKELETLVSDQTVRISKFKTMNDQLRAAVKDLQGRNMVKELKLVRVFIGARDRLRDVRPPFAEPALDHSGEAEAADTAPVTDEAVRSVRRLEATADREWAAAERVRLPLEPPLAPRLQSCATAPRCPASSTRSLA